MQIFGEEYENGALSLVRYSQIIGYNECAFFGVSSPSNIKYACREIWGQPQRDEIQNYLLEAEGMLRDVIGYPLKPTFIEDEQHEDKLSIITKWSKLLCVGIKGTEIISDGATVDYTSDPPTVTITPSVPISDLTQLRIYYPGTDVEIIPLNIVLTSMSTLVITIPKCRLVDMAHWNNPESGWVYTDDSNFQSTVDIHREYCDPSKQAEFTHSDRNCTSFCSESRDPGCEKIVDAEVGIMRAVLDGACRRMCRCTSYTDVRVNYECGLTHLDRSEESAIVRLAHSLMPNAPCGCDIQTNLWSRDRNVPNIVTQQRIECPFGLSDGAWFAWKWAISNTVERMGTTVGVYRGGFHHQLY